MYLNYGTFVLFLLGLFALYSSYKTPKNLTSFLSATGIGLLGFMLVMLPMLDVHDYYMIPSLPFLLTISVTGAMFVVSRLEDQRSAVSWKVLTFILIICIPVLGSARGLSRYVNGLKTAPYDLLTIEKSLDTAIPDKHSLVLASDDVSPSILLYYFHRKGWSVQESAPSSRIFGIRNQGAKYLISNSRGLENRPEIRASIDSVASYGRFTIFRFK